MATSYSSGARATARTADTQRRPVAYVRCASRAVDAVSSVRVEGRPSRKILATIHQSHEHAAGGRGTFPPLGPRLPAVQTTMTAPQGREWNAKSRSYRMGFVEAETGERNAYLLQDAAVDITEYERGFADGLRHKEECEK